jgi:prolipoprotein diacylglyceryl transferase
VTTTVLAYFPSPAQGVWYLGPVPIRAYALCIIAGIIAALTIGDRRWEARGGERGVIYDIALWAVPFGLIGGRLYHLATDWKTYFGENGAGIGAAVRIWDGGLGIWGAVALGGVGAWIACRRKGIPLPAFGDAIAPGIILAQAIGRVGNYFNQELYGRETTLPWGMEIFYRRDSSGMVDIHSLDGVSTGQVAAVVQPTFLYELLWNLLVFALLIYLDRRFTLGHGRLFAIYIASYCIGRFWVELLRDDTATHIAGIRVNSFTSTFVFIGAAVYILLAPKGREEPSSLGGTQIAADEQALKSTPAKELVSVGSGTGAAAKVTSANNLSGSSGSGQQSTPVVATAAGAEAGADKVAAAAGQSSSRIRRILWGVEVHR